MSETLARKDVAEAWGVKRQWIDQLVNAGRLITDDEGRIDAAHAAEVRATMDPEHMARYRLNQAAGGRPEADPLQEVTAKAKTKLALLKAEDAEIELKLKKGALVPKDLVTQQAYTIAKSFASQLQPLPEMLAPELAVLTEPNEIRDRLQKAFDQLLTDLRNGFASLGTPTA
jgi:phage terminase Nu1 subunit (DNA packaging protein)